MPSAELESMARRAGVSLRRAEQYWKKAKSQVETVADLRKEWPATVGLVKRRLGLANEDLAICGWPVELIVESRIEDCAGSGGCFITFDTENDEAKSIRESLQAAGADLFQQLPTGNVYSLHVSEEDSDTVKGVLRQHEIKPLAEKDVVDPHLTAAFLYDICRGSFGAGSVLLDSEGDIKFEQAFKEMLLLEGVSNWKEWLTRLFPHVDLDLVMFMADQGAKK